MIFIITINNSNIKLIVLIGKNINYKVNYYSVKLGFWNSIHIYLNILMRKYF